MPGTVPNPQLLKLGQARVYTSETLVTGDEWTARPYLYVDKLSDVAGPDIGQCNLRYDYGRFIDREHDLFTRHKGSGHYGQLDLNRHYVKVEVLDGDGMKQPEDAEPVYTWFGKIESVDDHQSVKYIGVDKSGTQLFRAFDLKCELADIKLRSSRIETPTDPITIRQALGFNVCQFGTREKHGNRTYQVVSEYNGYVFSLVPSTEHESEVTTTPESWTASQALKYLIKYHPPGDQNGTPAAKWQLSGESGLDWYEIRALCDGRSFLDVLNELVDRRRLVGYTLECSDTGEQFTITIKVFTFTGEDIPMRSRGATLPANANVVSLTAHTSPVTESLILSDVAAHRADRVVVEGDLVTSTFTLQYNNTANERQLVPGWDSSLQTEYDDAAGADELENTLFRQKDEYANVYTRFPLSDSWNQKAIRVSDDAEYYVVVDVDALPPFLNDDLVDAIFAVAGAEAGPWWHRGHKFESYLAIKDDNSKEYRRPFVLFQDSVTATEYILAEKLNLPHEPQYEFGVHVYLLQDRPGIRLAVSKSGGQQLIASGVFAGAATPESLDPDAAESVSYENMLATVTMAWDARLRVEKVLDATRPVMRTQYIRIPGRRLDFEIPGCVTGVDDAGALIESEGRVIRDDTEKLQNILTAAAEWYGTDRQAMRLTYKDTVPIVSVGQFITDVAIANTTETVNTPITGIAFDFLSGTCSIETSYADADFS